MWVADLIMVFEGRNEAQSSPAVAKQRVCDWDEN